MVALAGQERFEEAGLVRDRLRALADGLYRRRQESWLVGAGALVLRDRDGTPLPFHGGALLCGDGAAPITLPCPRDRADELAAVRSWLARHPARLEAAEVPPAEPVDGGVQLARLLARLRDAEHPPVARGGRRA
jgi:hypothetical protein